MLLTIPSAGRSLRFDGVDGGIYNVLTSLHTSLNVEMRSVSHAPKGAPQGANGIAPPKDGAPSPEAARAQPPPRRAPVAVAVHAVLRTNQGRWLNVTASAFNSTVGGVPRVVGSCARGSNYVPLTLSPYVPQRQCDDLSVEIGGHLAMVTARGWHIELRAIRAAATYSRLRPGVPLSSPARWIEMSIVQQRVGGADDVREPTGVVGQFFDTGVAPTHAPPTMHDATRLFGVRSKFELLHVQVFFKSSEIDTAAQKRSTADEAAAVANDAAPTPVGDAAARALTFVNTATMLGPASVLGRAPRRAAAFQRRRGASTLRRRWKPTRGGGGAAHGRAVRPRRVRGQGGISKWPRSAQGRGRAAGRGVRPRASDGD